VGSIPIKRGMLLQSYSLENSTELSSIPPKVTTSHTLSKSLNQRLEDNIKPSVPIYIRNMSFKVYVRRKILR